MFIPTWRPSVLPSILFLFHNGSNSGSASLQIINLSGFSVAFADCFNLRKLHSCNGENEKLIGIDHIAIIVSKEENLNFYKKLGFKEIRRITRAYDFVVFMKNGDVILEIFVDQPSGQTDEA